MAPEKSKVKKPSKKKPSKPVNLSIPKDKFDEVMELINNDDDNCEEYFMARCSVPIQNIILNHRNSFRNVLLKLLEEARLCLLQRDWKNLAKILTMVKPDRKDHALFFPMFVRYAVIYLAHNPDENLMDTFLQGVAGCSNEHDKKLFLNCFTFK